jgi:hypothetical protein
VNLSFLWEQGETRSNTRHFRMLFSVIPFCLTLHCSSCLLVDPPDYRRESGRTEREVQAWM